MKKKLAPAKQFAAHVLGVSHDDIPESVRRRARIMIADTLGAGIHGSTTAVGEIVSNEAIRRAGAGQAVLWGTGRSLDAAGAAFVNGTQSHAFELDDYSPSSKTHPAAVIVPTALAIAHPDTSGRELITSIVAAYDVMIRVSLAINPISARNRGFHMTGVAGPFGSAAVASRLLGLDEDEMVNALGIASSCSAGIFAFSAEGSMTKPLHAGRAAEAGIIAARLAQEGFQGPTAGLEAEDGGLLKAVSDDSDIGKLTEGLGENFEMSRVATKPYPCCGSNHSTIDAVLHLRRKHNLRTDQIERIEALNAAGVIMQCGFNYQGTGGPLEAQMSMQYCVAAALEDGQVGLKQFENDRWRDPVLIGLARRVSFVVDPEIDHIYPHEFPARIRVFLKTGEVLEHFVASPTGTPQNAMNDGQIQAKFRDVTSRVLGQDQQNRILEMTANLDDLPRVGDLNTVLAETGQIRGGQASGNQRAQ